MKQDDNFDEFHDKFNAIVNLIFNLGETSLNLEL